MTETKWQRERHVWVRGLSEPELQRVIAAVNESSSLDENEGDHAERRDAVEWLLSRGERGYDWGIPAVAGEDVGLWPKDG